ncbi:MULTISPECIES: hypothetical protein [Cellvibrio]|uniref:Bacterial surface antigen (D15) domain-containing protein n=1 Tax=Cellvibrio fibrivorans TaxID=126350 RepID=A0ABU1V088_9GAMM|nr:hypothetical protein [Cellvibrio fibrivorans]MDR7090788.1 hypothetical protein [Cellvibrio fibrivorans]
MIKTPRIGFFCASHFLLTVVFGVLSVGAHAQTELAVDTDPSCENFYVSREKVADAKDTRIDSKLFDGLEGKHIRSIQFNTLSVFDENDPDENNWLYLSLNKLHINTRPKVVRAQLLFEEGEALNVKKIQESERILRKRPYLTNAYIVPVIVCADQVDIMVVTQDAWALEPQLSLSKESEGTKSGFAIADGNIFGTGNSLTIGYEENTQRNLISYDFSNPHIFNSQIATRIYYADTSDGRDTIFDVSHPFYSLETPWAAGFYTQDVTLEEPIRHMDEQINEFRHQTMHNRIYFGLATDVTPTHTQRWLVGISNEEDNFFATDDTLQSIPGERKAVYPWIEYQYLENRYGVFKNVNQIQRPEDIALGQNLSFRLGYAGTQFDNPDDVVRYIGNYTNIVDFDSQHIFETTFELDGRHHSKLNGMDSTVAGINLTYNYFQDEKRRWYMGLLYEVGQDLAQYEELTVGDITGLRGYPTDYQRGDERYVFTVERRYFTDMHIFNLLRVGAVVFFDMGKAWGVEQYGYSPLLSNVGFGLRLSSSKVRIGNVVHIDIATPTSARNEPGVGKYQLTVGAQSRF